LGVEFIFLFCSFWGVLLLVIVFAVMDVVTWGVEVAGKENPNRSSS
jgi:hypothetical protein